MRFRTKNARYSILNRRRISLEFGKRAHDEYADALQRLGTSVSESLLYEGTILVEGEDDVTFLETGFPDVLRRLKVKDRGGRREIEKTIAQLQDLEKEGQEASPIYIIFDRDEEPFKYENTRLVRILQWPRRCIENYMIDVDVIAELLKDPSVTRKPLASAGEVYRFLKDVAFKQLNTVAARDIYSGYGFKNASLRKEDFKKPKKEERISDEERDLPEIAGALFERMSGARASMPDVQKDVWVDAFSMAVEIRKRELGLTWEGKWRELCDGKRFISDLHKAADISMAESAFKMRITRTMRDASSENWLLVKGLLEELILPP